MAETNNQLLEFYEEKTHRYFKQVKLISNFFDEEIGMLLALLSI
ncbi:MAG: hypothetical protein PHN69_07055 [Candidatus Pacebacteria bacterium]|nr:hypothetical protein [Candidatus Paceibacterota bacterium]